MNQDRIGLVRALRRISQIYHSRHDRNRSRAFHRAAEAIDTLNSPIPSGNQLLNLRHIGPTTARCIEQWLHERRIELLDNLGDDSTNYRQPLPTFDTLLAEQSDSVNINYSSIIAQSTNQTFTNQIEPMSIAVPAGLIGQPLTGFSWPESLVEEKITNQN